MEQYEIGFLDFKLLNAVFSYIFDIVFSKRCSTQKDIYFTFDYV